MIGLYILARVMAWMLAMSLLVLFIVVYMAWLLVVAVGRSLVDHDTWNDHPEVGMSPPRVPRNDRLYHSDRS